MTPWLLITPALCWLLFATIGRAMLRCPADQLWRGMQITTAKKPFDPNNVGQRFVIASIRFQGWLLLAVCLFITLMAALVALGFVSPAQH